MRRQPSSIEVAPSAKAVLPTAKSRAAKTANLKFETPIRREVCGMKATRCILNASFSAWLAMSAVNHFAP
ncbi:MAG: hypothetical protein SFU86_02650 [Pirellulaceae bacterium]|nr:hypothetical protein [Pirellulaceae bacterium]